MASSNGTNLANSTPDAASAAAITLTTRLIGAAVLSGITVVSVTANALLFAVFTLVYYIWRSLIGSNCMFQGNIPFKNSAFFTIACQMLCVDLIGLSAQLMLVLPETWSGTQLYSTDVVRAMGAADTLSYNAGLLFALLLTLNRLCIFVAPSMDKAIFTRPRIFVSISLCWVLAIILMVGTNATHCYKNFSVKGYYLFHDCSNLAPEGLIFTAELTMFSYIPYLIIAFYALIILKMRLSRLRMSRRTSPAPSGMQTTSTTAGNKHELRLLLQSFLICSVYLVESFGFYLLPKMPIGGQGKYAMNFAAGALVILFNTVHSAVIFAFNATARDELIMLLCRERQRKQKMGMNVHVTMTNVPNAMYAMKDNSHATVMHVK